MHGRCWPIPGGRPLRRRRENGVVIGAPRLRGTAALQASIDHRFYERMGHCWPILSSERGTLFRRVVVQN
jgi:hypothetical protein